MKCFSHFLKPKAVINCLWELDEINFKIQRNCANTGEISSSVSFHFQEFRQNFKIYLRHFVAVRIDFF